MRYLGNKESIVSEIADLLDQKEINQDHLTFFDAFCGTGSVSDHLKSKFDLILNDNLNWATIYAKGRICAPSCTFQQLGFDPFDFLNENHKETNGFINQNYSPAHCQRMYFTAENASRIDYFREQIETWYISKQISEEEYCFLLASLIESVSSVSNTAGVYGAYLKKWDSRALKNITFSKVNFNPNPPKNITIHHDKIEHIIQDIDCDILYLDPPYTQNQYGTQYHLLETLILNDNPEISKVTGSRSTSPMRSDWSKELKVNILLDKIIAKTKAKYIILSYSSQGLMSKSFIEATFKRYGKPESYTCKKISYKKYQNWKSKNDENNFEYLFFIEKKPPQTVYYESPLNYTGSKAKIIHQIISHQPAEFDTFLDCFGGGFNVGINISANKIIYNDINYLVSDLINSFKLHDTYDYLLYIRRTIKKFKLEKADSTAYLNARNFYNTQPPEKRDPRLLFTIILYGFQQQIRFNSQHQFNNPVGLRWFNDKVLEKMISFSRKIKEIPLVRYSENYQELDKEITQNSFVYFDPPYMLTTGAYNDGKRGFNGWNLELEKDLFNFADKLNQRGIPFMLSYVVEHKGIINQNLLQWIEREHYNLIPLGDILGISGSKRKEVLITNYEQ